MSKRLGVYILFLVALNTRVVCQNNSQYPDVPINFHFTPKTINVAHFSKEYTKGSLFFNQKARTGPLKEIGFKDFNGTITIGKKETKRSLINLSVFDETEGPHIDRIRVLVGCAYVMQLKKDFHMSLGANYGLIRSNYIGQQFGDFSNNSSSGSIALFGRYRKTELGLSVKQLFGTYPSNNSTTDEEFKPYLNIYFSQSIPLDVYIDLNISVLNRWFSDKRTELITDFQFEWREYYGAGVNYSLNTGVGGYFFIQPLKDKIPASIIILYKSTFLSGIPNSFNHFEIGVSYTFKKNK